MSIRELDREEILEMSAVELAHILMQEEKKPYPYNDLLDRIAELKELSKEEKKNRMTKLFTTLNVDGRFVHLGENHWGLKRWYTVDKSEEDLRNTVKKPKKKKKSVEEEEADFLDEDLDEFEDLEDELDELSQAEDADELEKTKKPGE